MTNGDFRVDVCDPLPVGGEGRLSFSIVEDRVSLVYSQAVLSVTRRDESLGSWSVSEAGLRGLANACLAAAEHLRETNHRLCLAAAQRETTVADANKFDKIVASFGRRPLSEQLEMPIQSPPQDDDDMPF